MNIKKLSLLLTLVFFFIINGFLGAQPVLRLVSEKGTDFDIGEIFEIEARLENNQGAYGVFLDIQYNNSVFELLSISPGDLLPELQDRSELLFAQGAYNEGGRLIVSNTQVGDRELFYHDGTVIRMFFKALRSGSDQSMLFNGETSGIYVYEMEKRPAEFEGLTGLNVIGPYRYYFAQIISPYNNFKTTENKIDFMAQCTIRNPAIDDEFEVGLSKVAGYYEDAALSPGTRELLLPGDDGFANFTADMEGMFELVPGYNYIIATLYVNGETRAKALKRVYYETRSRGVFITSPVDNTITGKSIISVAGSSSFEKVTINNMLVDTKKIDGETYSFLYDRQKLKQGFNKITARTENPLEPDVIYKDEIVIYYQRDESIFSFISPGQETIFKSGKIPLYGVIDTIETELVRVKMRAHFKPYGPGEEFHYAFKDTDLFNSEIILRELEDSENFLLSHYIFETEFDLGLINGPDYGSGELNFYAVKVDKTGDNADVEISLKVILDREKLKIELKQPNLFSEESLTDKARLLEKGFITSHSSVDISETARVTLMKNNEPKVYREPALGSEQIKKVVNTLSGTQYAIVNSIPNRIEIYEKKADEDLFKTKTMKVYYNAYANTAVEFGNNMILIGTSDYNRGQYHPSGLVLLNNGLLRTARLSPDEKVNHVQYICKVGTDYYIYATNYNYLYKFNEADVIINQYDDTYFEIRNLKKYYLPNNLYINDFVVTDNGNTIVLGTELGVLIYRYNPIGNAYALKTGMKEGYEILHLKGVELESKYNIYLYVYREKKPRGEPAPLYFSSITQYENEDFIEKDISELTYNRVFSINSFENNTFIIYGKETTDIHTLKKVEIFNGLDSISASFLNASVTDGDRRPDILIKDSSNITFYGKGLTVVTDEYIADGSIEFIISDSAVDGLTGFHFDAPSIYRDLLTVQYVLTNTIDDAGYIEFNGAGRPLSKKPLSHYGFSSSEGYTYLKLRFDLKRTASGLNAAFFENLLINKKEIVKSISPTLDIKGVIRDKTVGSKSFTINGKIVELAPNGVFSDTINLNTGETNRITNVRLYAANNSGETDETVFKVNYVVNEPKINNISITHDNGVQNQVPVYPVNAPNSFQPEFTTGDTIDIRGKFSGLAGVHVSAEAYTLDEQNEASRFITSHAALFENEENADGELSGDFIISNFELVPGIQRIILRCMNPYGNREELKFDINFDVIEEKLIILNYSITGERIDEVFEVTKNEQGEYLRTFEIVGKVISSKPVDHVNIRSDNDYISFTKGDEKDVSFIKVPLTEIGKRFSVFVNIKMEDHKESFTDYFKIWPDSLQLTPLGRDLYVSFVKKFGYIEPDFGPTEFNSTTGEIKIKFLFNEPVPRNMLMRMRFNHKNIFPGTEYPFFQKNEAGPYFTYENGIYSLNKILRAEDGTNILDWWFYKDNEQVGTYENTDTMLSRSGNSNYMDFYYETGETYEELKIVFPDKDQFLDMSTLGGEMLNITFDPRGDIIVKLNAVEIENPEQHRVGNQLIIDLTTFPGLLEQGINTIEVHYTLASGNIDVVQRSAFKFDSLDPGVTITSIESAADFVYPYINSVTVEVTEANLSYAYLVYDNSIVRADPDVTILGDNTFIYQWNNLEALKILPSAIKTFYAEAIDMTTKVGTSRIVNSGLSLYYDIQLSNNVSDTKVLNYPDIRIGGSLDPVTDFSAYRNERNKTFDYHLKYETTKLLEDGVSIRDDVTGDLTKDVLFNSSRKYLMFVFDTESDLQDVELGYRRENRITKKAVVAPGDMLIHQKYTHYPYVDTVPLGITHNEKPVYSRVIGHTTNDPKYLGEAIDIKVSSAWDRAFILEHLDEDRDGRPDYRAIIVYNIEHNMPSITHVIDYAPIQKIRDFKIKDNFIYAVCEDEGILIYDFTDLNNTRGGYISTIEAGNCYDFVIKGNYIYVASGSDGIKIFDITDITFPIEVFTETNPSYAPIALTGRNNYLYAVTADNKIVGYITGTNNVSASLAGSLEPGSLNRPRIWIDSSLGNYLHVLPRPNSRILHYDYSTLTLQSRDSFNVTNIPRESPVGMLYPTLYNIRTESGGNLNTFDYTGSHGLAVNGTTILSIKGTNGLQIFAPDKILNYDFLESYEEGKVVDDWNSYSDPLPIYENGVLNMPWDWDGSGTRSSTISHSDDYFIDTTKELKYQFKLNHQNSGDRSYYAVLRFQFSFRTPSGEYIGIIKDYFSSREGNLRGTVSSNYPDVVYLSEGDWHTVTINFSENGIPPGSKLTYMNAGTQHCHNWGTGSSHTGVYTNLCRINYIDVPIYRSFNLPISHAAFKIDHDPGFLQKMDVPMNLFNEGFGEITETGQVMVYFPVDNEVDNVIKEKFDEMGSGDQYGQDLDPIEYGKSDYFDERLPLYKTGQCKNKQTDDSWGEGVTLDILNILNETKFESAYNACFMRRAKEGLSKIPFGEAREELVILNPPDTEKYKTYLSDTLIVAPPAEGVRISEKTRKDIYLPRGKNGALSFWLRLEDEVPWFKNRSKDNELWRDYNTTHDKPLVAWGDSSVIPDDAEATYRFVVSPKKLRFVQYKAGSGINKEEKDIEPGNFIEASISNSNTPESFYGKWHLLTLTWDYIGGLVLYINNQRINDDPVHMHNFDFDKFLSERIVFGDISENVDSFNFSIAAPKVFNNTLSAKEVEALFLALNRLQGAGEKVQMKFDGDLFLIKDMDSPDDVSGENPVFEDTLNGKGFVSTGGMKNFISEDLENDRLMLTDQLHYTELIKDNAYAEYSGPEDKLYIRRETGNGQGYYHLTNGGGTGLGIPGDESYTFSGTLYTTGLTPDDECIIKINGVEKHYPLSTGNFKFTYSGLDQALASIDVYFRFTKDLEFKASGFGFNTGRYKGNNYTGYPDNFIRMRHGFHFKETLVTYYQPLFESGWELNNKEVVIIDSELYKIGISNNRYYAVLKTLDREIMLRSNSEIRGGLHQLCVVYDFSSLTFKFYIDAKLEAYYEGPTFAMPYAVGHLPDVYNITPGGSMDHLIKAGGILDELIIYPEEKTEKFIQEDFYAKTRIISIAEEPFFDDSEITLHLSNNLDRIVDIEYLFDGGQKQSLSIQAQGAAEISGIFNVGPHTLTLYIDSGVSVKTETYNFFVNYAPVVNLSDYKSFIIRGDKDFSFKMERDFQHAFAEKKEFIELKLYMSDNRSDLILKPVQHIKEDRVYSNFGKYITNDDYTTLSDNLEFVVEYEPGQQAEIIYYMIAAYYYGQESGSGRHYTLEGEIKIVDINEPEIIRDLVTGRPWKVISGIKNFNREQDNTNGISCEYGISRLNRETQEYEIIDTGEIFFNPDGQIILDVYGYPDPGSYMVRFQPMDEPGNKGVPHDVEFSIETMEELPGQGAASEVVLDDLELILLDTENSLAKYNFSGHINNINDDESYILEAILEDNDGYTVILNEENVTGEKFNRLLTLDNLKIGVVYTLEARIYYDETIIVKEVVFQYRGIEVDVNFTHGPSGFISYNNVYFNWEGTLDGELDSRVEYRYRMDNAPWGLSLNNHMEFYNLPDGEHSFTIQAFFGDREGKVYSAKRSLSFTIDTEKPVIDETKITLNAITEDSDIKMYLELIGVEGAVKDDNLFSVTVNGDEVPFADGGFKVDYIPLEIDGENRTLIEVWDILGNSSSLEKIYNYEILEITYPPTIKDLKNPENDEIVKYSPLTVYGLISDNIEVTEDLKIYVDDPYGRREATINFDRSFFIENLRINPGSKYKTIQTNLKFTTEFGNNKTIVKEYPVFARHVIKPVELQLSIHAVSGGAATTEVQMTAVSDVTGIASFSFDYDGDGVFDEEYFTNNQSITVYRKYSTVGKIHPRVRVITNDNHYFSGGDTLIIHDKIIKADLKPVIGAKSIDIIEIDDTESNDVDGYEYVYILQETENSNIVKRYVIEANNAVLVDNNSLYVNLTEQGINNPEYIKVDKNGDLYVACLYRNGGKIYKLFIASSGAYVIDEDFDLVIYDEVIGSFDIGEENIYITSGATNDIMKYKKDSSFVLRQTVNTDSVIEDISTDSGIEAAADKLWIADYKKQRIISASSDNFKLRDFFGEPGSGEGQFISPAIVRVMGNYIYVLDASEKTIQVFEEISGGFRIICRIDNAADYLPRGFMNYITDMAVFTKLESKRHYHYLALLNREYEEIALLRIPQWQPNSIKVKSNLIGYVKNNEIFTSKSDGADARKIFSSGSLPGVDGNVDYPAIAPDGETIAFVSRIERFEYMALEGGFVFRKYDKLYLIDVDGKNCRLIDDPEINDKEIDRPQFSSSGTKVIFSAKSAGHYWAIYEYDLIQKKINKLFEPEADCTRPTYSPNDRYIAYTTKYHNHNEIIIYDTRNPDLLIPLTNNDYSDDYPVWTQVFPEEIGDEEAKITSKIAFISKPDFEEKVFYIYISQRSSGDFRIVKKDGSDIGGDPDAARNEMNIDYEETGLISYPCFTADGKNLIFESHKDGVIKLMQYNLQTEILENTGVPGGARRPSGMKNRITGLHAEVLDGNDIYLQWNRYADENLIYTVEYLSSESDAEYVEKSFRSQDHALIEDLRMGLTYDIRVFVKDLLRGGEITTSVWKKIVVLPAFAKPTISIDPNNPYLVRMEAWKPETDKPWEYPWQFTWYIENYKVEDTFSQITEYEFSTSGIKRFALEVYPEGGAAKTHRSEDVFIDVKGDLSPVINYGLIETNNSLSIELDATSSTGSKIDRSNYKWKLSGSHVSGTLPQEQFEGDKVVRSLEGYSGNVAVILTVTSLPVMGQIEQNREEKSVTVIIPLGLREIKPVITAESGEEDSTFFTFDGSSSIGNVDWSLSTWEIFGPGNLYYETRGKTGFTYKFPETNEDTNYIVILNARNKASGNTVTEKKLITVGKIPIEPVIDYKVITTSSGGKVVNAKLLLSAANSRGNDIDWNVVRWDVPLADEYGRSITQTGPAVVYHLFNINEGISVDVHLILQRKGSGEIMEVAEVIQIEDEAVPSIEPYIEVLTDKNEDLYAGTEGDVYIFSALNSKGPNIDWDNVSWLIDGQYERKGPVVRVDLKDSGENNQSIVASLTLSSTGGGPPVNKTLSYNLESKRIKILITKNTKKTYIAAGDRNIAGLSVRDSIGRNIDWERTRWLIYNGPENITEKYGAEIIYAFPISAEVEYYPVLVQMFFKDSTKPFTKMTNVRVKQDRLMAVIKEEIDGYEDENSKYVRTFSAADSLGESIDWQNCKWTFGDSSEYQYGPVATHRFPTSRDDIKYLVTLTIGRRTKDGKTENSTDTYKVSIGRDEIDPVISIVEDGHYVVFSAEKSKGRGLLLDRSMWLFEGPDSENYSESESESASDTTSVTTSLNYNIGGNFSVSAGWSAGGMTGGPTFNATTGFTWGTGVGLSVAGSATDTNTASLTSGESSNNIYSGASCRKMIHNGTIKRVTLLVYRALPDGTIEAKTKSFIYTKGQRDVQVIE